jgi:RNA polymerase sigma factor (TIGR02999 family)
MSDRKRHEITQILLDLHADKVDHRSVVNSLFDAVYAELHRLATDLMRRERSDHTLQSTALVHEAYIRLVDDSRIEWQNRAHFFGTAARAMRQILVDHARGRLAAKRGGAQKRVTLDESLGLATVPDVEILDLEQALVSLAEMHPRSAQVVELRVFGGLKVTEIAHVLGLSRQTIHDDWRVAKLWLCRELAEGTSP